MRGRDCPEYFQVAGPTMLFVANHVIDLVDADHATGAVYCLAKLDIAGRGSSRRSSTRTTTSDARRWRFAQRRHLLWYGVELPERPFDQPKTQWPFDATGRGSLPGALPGMASVLRDHRGTGRLLRAAAVAGLRAT